MLAVSTTVKLTETAVCNCVYNEISKLHLRKILHWWQRNSVALLSVPVFLHMHMLHSM